MPARPLTRHQALENAAFLKALRETGNARAAARSLGAHRAKFTKRRAKHPGFAAEWDAALALAHASLGRATPPTGAEPRVVRTRSGRLQLRRAAPAQLTRAHEQAFLAALSATANVRLAAAATGFSHSAFYARRKASPAFAREMRLALEMGYERLELALLESALPCAHADDAWRHNDPPPIPPMTAAEALQLLHLHHKTVRLWAERPDRKRKRGETSDQQSARLGGKWRAERARDAEDAAIDAAARAEGDGAGRSPHEPEPPALPALDRVTGWSKADPAKTAHHPDVALFGGWRLGDWQGRKS